MMPSPEQVSEALERAGVTVPASAVARWPELKRLIALGWCGQVREHKRKRWSRPTCPDFIWAARAERKPAKP